MDAPTRWLDEEQQEAWRALIGVVLRLPGALEGQLQADAGLSHFEYWVLALLSEAEGRRLPLSTLAGQASASLSRLSHVVTRLQRRGWVERVPSADDARVTLAQLTDDGWVVVRGAAPGHVDRVRSLVFDQLGPEDVDHLRRVCEAVLQRVDAADRCGSQPPTASTIAGTQSS